MTELEQKAEEYFSHHNYALHNRYGVQKDIHRMIYKDGYAQGVIETLRIQSSIQNSYIADLEQARKENAELKEDLQILFNMLNGGDKNEFEQQRIGEMWNLCF